MKILIADDHSVVREGLKKILENLKIANLIEEATNGYEALEKIKSGKFDFVILDISMPGLNGLDILKKMKILKLKINILILSVFQQSQYAVQSLRMGASGYLSKDSSSEELALAIKKISSGGKYISTDILGILLSDDKSGNVLPLHNILSEREFQIMILLAKGVSIVEIGKKLFISEKTVSTYRTRLLKKMCMISNSELALYAFKNNLIQ